MMVKRNLVIFIVPTFFFSTISAYLYFENVANHNLLIEYKANAQRLLSQVKGIGEEKVAQEKELSTLRDEISRLNVRLAARPQSNMVIEENALSDYREAEDEMRKGSKCSKAGRADGKIVVVSFVDQSGRANCSRGIHI